MIWPLLTCALPGSIRRMDIAVAVLPEPLSPDERERLPLAQRERDIAHGADLAAARVEGRVEVTDLQDGTRSWVVAAAASVTMAMLMVRSFGTEAKGARRSRTPLA